MPISGHPGQLRMRLTHRGLCRSKVAELGAARGRATHHEK